MKINLEKIEAVYNPLNIWNTVVTINSKCI